MTNTRSFSLCMLALCLALTGACALPDDPAVTLDETEHELSAFNWSAPGAVSSSTVWFAQVATHAGTTYMVHAGPGYKLYWRQLVGSTWTTPVEIPGRFSQSKVSLASFNGYLYMVHTDYTVQSRLWLSRFSPSTGTWSTSVQLSHTSAYGPPAIAAYSGRLYFIGVTPSSNKLWMASMNSAETITAASPMEGHYSASRVSAAVFSCRLYIAHRAGTTSTVVYNSFNGSSWTYDQTIPAGAGGAAITAHEPVIAERSGYLHLLHRNTTGGTGHSPVWWTYFNGGTWASELSLGSSVSTYYPPSLAQGGAGLVAITTTYYNSLASSLQYTQALPLYPPLCGISPPIFL